MPPCSPQQSATPGSPKGRPWSPSSANYNKDARNVQRPLFQNENKGEGSPISRKPPHESSEKTENGDRSGTFAKNLEKTQGTPPRSTVNVSWQKTTGAPSHPFNLKSSSIPSVWKARSKSGMGGGYQGWSSSINNLFREHSRVLSARANHRCVLSSSSTCCTRKQPQLLLTFFRRFICV